MHGPFITRKLPIRKGIQGQVFSLSQEPPVSIKVAMDIGCIVVVGKIELNILMINETN